MPHRQDIRREVPQGTVVFREGEPGDCAYVIESGTVEISTRRGGERVVIAERFAGEIFGEMAIVDNRPRSATVTAATECSLLVLSAEQVQARMQALDPVLRMVLTVILDRFRDTMNRFKSESGQSRQSLESAAQGCPETRLQAHQEAIERIKLEQSIKTAIEREELLLHFQPIVCCKTGRIGSFESLVRWQHPSQGLISPATFITAAEQSSLICEISRYVFDKACAALKRLRAAGAGATPPNEQIRISVNTSARDFANTDFVDYVEDCIGRHGVEADWLTLEITESMLMQNPDVTLEILQRCRGIGLSIAIDDFGTGYSSLSYLNRFPLEALKIDRSFLADLEKGASGKEVIRAMVALGHGLGLKVIAEGVESAEQASIVQLFGCDGLQGFLFSKPLPLDEACDLIGSWQDFRDASPKRDGDALPTLSSVSG